MTGKWNQGNLLLDQARVSESRKCLDSELPYKGQKRKYRSAKTVTWGWMQDTYREEIT